MKVYGQLEKAQLENLSSDPATAALGYAYYNTVLDQARILLSTGWAPLGSAAAAQIAFTPAGNLSSVTVQAALVELDTEKEPAIAAGSAGQYWRYDKSWATLDTAAVAENSNLYFTTARARAAISATAPAAYNSTTGAISVAVMVGDSGSGGTAGLVPAPGIGDAAAGKFLAADGTWTSGGSGGFTNPMTTVGDIMYGGVAGAATRRAGDTSDTRKYLLGLSVAGVATAPVWSTIQAADIPTLNQNTSGTAATFTGNLSGDVSSVAMVTTIGAGKVTNAMLAGSITFANLVGTDITALGTIATGTWSATTIALNKGGTGQTTKAAAYDALSPLSTLGDLVYGGASGTGTRLAGNTTTTKKFLTQTGDATNSAAPTWGTIASADVPTLNQNTTGSAGLNVLKAGDTMTGALINSFAGAASSGAVAITGAPYAAGTATTNKPHVLLENSGTSTGWSTAGTYLGINAPAAFAGRLFDMQIDGVTKAYFGVDGQLTQANSTETVVAGFSAAGTWTLDNSSHSTSKFFTYRTNTQYCQIGIITPGNNWGPLSVAGTSAVTTTVASLIPNTVHAMLNVRNSSSAVNNFEGIIFSGNTDKMMAAIYCVNKVHTAASETGELHVAINNAGTKADVAVISSAGLWQWNAYTTMGALRNDVSGNISSVANPDFGLNYAASNPDAALATTGWVTYADAAGTSPVDGTGGSPTFTWTRSTSSPLRGAANFLATKDAANRQGEGVAFAFTLDAADQGKICTVSFDYAIGSGTYATGDLTVWIYDVTNSVMIQPAGSSIVSAVAGVQMRQLAVFQAPSNSTSYRLIIHTATTSASAYTVKIASVYVGPQALSSGPAMTDWVAYTVVITSTGTACVKGTTTTDQGFWRRNGDSIEIVFNYKQSGAGTVGTGNYLFSLPTGITIDTAKCPTATTSFLYHVGVAHASNSTGSSARLQGNVLAYDSTHLAIGLTSGTFTDWNFASATTTPLSDAAQVFTFSARVPVVGWSSNVAMSSDTDTRIVAARYKSTAGNSFTGASVSVVDYATKDYDTHAAVTTGAAWKFTAPVPGKYQIKASIAIGALSWSAGNRTQLALFKNGSLVCNLTQVQAWAAISTAMIVTGSDEIDLIAGDYIDVRNDCSQNGSFAASSDSMHIAVERLSGPSTIAASESVNARYYASATSLSGSLATISWTTKDYDSHLAMSAGTFTCPTPGKYQVNAAVAISGTFVLNNVSIIEIQKNGSVVSRYKNYAGAAVTQLDVEISDQIPCIAGDTIRVQVSNSGTGPAIVSSNFENYCSIFRTGN